MRRTLFFLVVDGAVSLIVLDQSRKRKDHV